MEPVYFDHNATTPIDPRAAAAMRPWLGERHGNPSSIHAFGRRAREAVEHARQQVAELIGARTPEVLFTSSGTEANNTVLRTVAEEAGYRGDLIVSGLEHPSVAAEADRLARAGLTVTRVPPEADGVVAAERMIEAVGPETRLVCLMLANNEVGTVQPVAEVAAACRERGVPVLCDAVQAVGKIPVDVGELAVDYLTIGAHKFHGPLGAAALWVRPSAAFAPLLIGGGQERRRRAGTENVPALVGFGANAEIACRELPRRFARLAALRESFETGLAGIDDVVVHCRQSPRLPHTSHVACLGVEAESLLIRLDLAGFAVSTGSACSAGVVEPSQVLSAMGVGRSEALASLRISFGLPNRLAEVDAFLGVLARELAELRRLAPVA